MRSDRAGLCPIRHLTYIKRHPSLAEPWAREEPRCPTCGRAFDCCCPGCDCAVSKDGDHVAYALAR